VGRDSGGDLTNVQYKPIWNCHKESPLYNEHILIKKLMGKKDLSQVLPESREPKCSDYFTNNTSRNSCKKIFEVCTTME
jgi:hypothetical protein